MNQAQCIFNRALNAAVIPVAGGSLQSSSITLSAHSGLPMPLRIELSRDGNELFGSLSSDFTGRFDFFRAASADALISRLEAEFAAPLNSVCRLKIILSGKPQAAGSWVNAGLIDEEHAEFRVVAGPVAQLLELACRETVEAVFSGKTNFAQLCVRTEPQHSNDTVWINVSSYRSGDQQLVFQAETNDRDLMVGCPPSFYLQAQDPEEMVASIMEYLSLVCIEAQAARVLLRGVADCDREGDSQGLCIKDREIFDLPV